jgi:hypothetical protein
MTSSTAAAAMATAATATFSDSPLLESWKKEVVGKLLEIFKEAECELIARVLWYLSEEEKSMNENTTQAEPVPEGSEVPVQVQIPPGLKALKATIDWDELFTHYARHLAQETKESPERNAAFLKDMKVVFEEMAKKYPPDELVSADLSESESETESGHEGQEGHENEQKPPKPKEEPIKSDKDKFVLVRTSDCDGQSEEDDEGHGKGHGKGQGHGVLSHLWGWVELATKHALIKAIPPIFVNRQFMFALDEFINIVDHAGAKVVMVGLAGVCLSFEAIKNLYQWWGGQITGKRCAKNLVDATFMVGGGVLGGIGGATLGSAMGGPFGTVAGGIIGGIVSSQVLHALCDILTQTLFDLPKDAALENALNYLGVPMSATNGEINAAFRKKCLQHHPDKGGKSEDFILLQANMAVIKLARGELL